MKIQEELWLDVTDTFSSRKLQINANLLFLVTLMAPFQLSIRRFSRLLVNDVKETKAAVEPEYNGLSCIH